MKISFGKKGFTDFGEIETTHESLVSRPVVMGRKSQSGTLELVIRRDGPSGPLYTIREVKLEPLASRYLAEGDDVEELFANLEARAPGPYVELDETDKITPMYQIALQAISRAYELKVLS